MNEVLLYVAAGMTGVWGVSHLFATKGVVRGFGDLSVDNRRVITMEWIVEGVALLSMAALVAAITAIDHALKVATGAYAVAIGTLVVLAVVSLFTGFKIHFLPYRLCPFIFTLSAVLIALGAWL